LATKIVSALLFIPFVAGLSQWLMVKAKSVSAEPIPYRVQSPNTLNCPECVQKAFLSGFSTSEISLWEGKATAEPKISAGRQMGKKIACQ